MLSLFKKVKNSFKSETCILEEFVEHHGLHIAESDREFHAVPHVRNEESEPLTTLVYRVTKQEVEMLKKELWHICDKVIHEDGLWYMGNIQYAGRQVGFYLGMSHELDHEWARFWLE